MRNLILRAKALRHALREAALIRPQINRVAAMADEVKALNTQLSQRLEAVDALCLKLVEELRAVTSVTNQLNRPLDEVRALEAHVRSLEARMREAERSTDQKPLFREAIALMQLYCNRHAMPARPFMVVGYPKCGNTLTRLVYHNLIAVANAGATQTMTYTRLNQVNPNHSFPSKLLLDGFCEPADFDHAGFPFMLHSHERWEPFWDNVANLLFIERHPLDSLIGHWYTQVRFPERPREQIGVDEFVLRELPDWIDRYRINRPRAKAYLSYEEIMSEPDRAFGDAFRALGISFNPDHLHQAIAMSTFDKVRQMEDATGQHHGHLADPTFQLMYDSRGWLSTAEVRFTRSGKTGQWATELTEQTIRRAAEILSEAGLGHYAERLASAA